MKTPGPESRILLFGGTTEGRRMAGILSGYGMHVTVCVATRTGADCLQEIPGLRILTGRKDAAAMKRLMAEGYDCCIDATHPYAVEAGRAIKSACAASGLPCCRLLRRQLSAQELSRLVEDRIRQFRKGQGDCEALRLRADAEKETVHFVMPRFYESAEKICSVLAAELGEQPHGTDSVLLTLGAKEAAVFSPLLVRHAQKLFIRVLPAGESIRMCLDAGFSGEQILTGRGPFSVEENVRTLTKYGIRYLVTKDSGIEGGYPEKLAAAALCRAKVMAVRRPAEEGYDEQELLHLLGVRT